MIIDDGESKVTKIPVNFKKTDQEQSLLDPYDLPHSVRKSKCFHKKFVVDESLAEVECADCGEKLNPMWVLRELCKKESIWRRAARRYSDEMKRLKERSRTKCYSCGAMTPISKR